MLVRELDVAIVSWQKLHSKTVMVAHGNSIGIWGPNQMVVEEEPAMCLNLDADLKYTLGPSPGRKFPPHCAWTPKEGGTAAAVPLISQGDIMFYLV